MPFFSLWHFSCILHKFSLMGQEMKMQNTFLICSSEVFTFLKCMRHQSWFTRRKKIHSRGKKLLPKGKCSELFNNTIKCNIADNQSVSNSEGRNCKGIELRMLARMFFYGWEDERCKTDASPATQLLAPRKNSSVYRDILYFWEHKVTDIEERRNAAMTNGPFPLSWKLHNASGHYTMCLA